MGEAKRRARAVSAGATPEPTKHKLLNLVGTSGDGYMFCLDLDHAEGRIAADNLQDYPDVKRALLIREKAGNALNTRYMLILMPFRGGGKAVIMLANDDMLAAAVAKIHKRSRDFGLLFAVVIAPPDDKIATMFAELQDSDGTA